MWNKYTGTITCGLKGTVKIIWTKTNVADWYYDI